VVSRTQRPEMGVASSKQQCEGRAAAERDTSPDPESERALLPIQIAKRRAESSSARMPHSKTAHAG